MAGQGGRCRTRTLAAGLLWVGGVGFASGASPRPAHGQAYGETRGTLSERSRGVPRAAPKRRPRSRAIALCLRPRAGDTVRTRFEQTVRLTPRRAAAAAHPDAETPAAEGAVLTGAAARSTPPASAMLVIARSIVQRVDASGAQLLAITDSVAFSAAGAPPAVVERMRRAMQGRRAELHVAPDGALAASGWSPGDAVGVGSTLRLPGTLPEGAVAPGATWRRAMAVPSWGPAATPPHLDVKFRFDSIAADGARAYISLRGRVHDAASGDDRDTTLGALGTENATEAGHVDGGLVVDLTRGWVVESWTTFRLDGMMVSAPGATPTPVRVVVTQRLRAY